MYYAKGKKNGLLTKDIFYDGLGDDDLTRQQNYQMMVVDKVIAQSYLKSVWGSDDQRYHENKKVRYHLNKK